MTTDQNLRHQQNLAGRRIGIVVLLSTAWPEIRRCTEEISQAIAAVRPGEVVELSVRPD